MIQELEDIIANQLPTLLKEPEKWDSLLIDHFPPVIHRLAYRLSDTRTLFLHKMHNCERSKALLHSHSWALAVKVIEGGYEMGMGESENRDCAPTELKETIVKPGDVYEMLDSRQWHYTKCLPETKYSYSIMLIGPRTRERKALNNDPLSLEQRHSLFDYFKNVPAGAKFVREG